MQKILKPCAAIATAVTLASVIWTGPAQAECIIEGIAYRVMQNGESDPTGPTLYLKASPEDSFYYFVRFRDGQDIEEIQDALGQVRVLVHGDAFRCPPEGIVRDAGTAIRKPQVIEFAAKVPTTD